MVLFGSCCAAQDFQRVWQAQSGRDAERLTLVWEAKELLALNFSIVAFLKDQVSPQPTHHSPLVTHPTWPSGRMLSVHSCDVNSCAARTAHARPELAAPTCMWPKKKRVDHNMECSLQNNNVTIASPPPDGWESEITLPCALCFGQAAQAAGKWFLNAVAHGIMAALTLPLTALSATSLIDMQWNVVRPMGLATWAAPCMHTGWCHAELFSHI